MSSHKPLADAKAIEHLDWTLLCEVHVHGYAENGSKVTELEPPCEEKATLCVTYHRISSCRVVTDFMCTRHFNDLFVLLPETHKVCPVCGETRFRSAKPLIP